ncbi:MAG TPA: 3'-5' exonuclease [Myxococcota bacterium]|nr:3'-5' exonuclease [Myxococcota bacterium]
MIREVAERVWAFDLEWVPDPLAGRVLYDLPDSLPDADVLREMWRAGGATEEDPTPFLKTAVCRIVSIAVVERRARDDGPGALRLLSLPHAPRNPDEAREADVVGRFLEALGKYKPQLVGFNSHDSDLKILVQRALVLGVQATDFADRPDKPWNGPDYFARASDSNIDLKQIVGGWGKAVPSLHEIAVQCGIPGKLDVDGNDVARMWLEGRLPEIVAYNEMDALTTYLVWLRLAHFGGYFTTAGYQAEQAEVWSLVEREMAAGKPYLGRYLDAWSALRARVASR